MENPSVSESARLLTDVWRAHDERNEVAGRDAATGLYKELCKLHPNSKPDGACLAGFLTIQAFFAADEAEKYQNKDPTMEVFFYNKARTLLEKARNMVGLETKSPTYTVLWWRAYRHNDEKGLAEGLVNEHKAQFPYIAGGIEDKYAELCTQKLLDAAMSGHATHDWPLTAQLLEDYFRFYYEALGNGFERF